MANFKCVAPGHNPLAELTEDNLKPWAVHPEFSEYHEVHLCARCASDARQEGVRTVELSEARKIIERHAIAVQRVEFFRSFIPATQEESEAGAA